MRRRYQKGSLKRVVEFELPIGGKTGIAGSGPSERSRRWRRLRRKVSLMRFLRRSIAGQNPPLLPQNWGVRDERTCPSTRGSGSDHHGRIERDISGFMFRRSTSLDGPPRSHRISILSLGLWGFLFMGSLSRHTGQTLAPYVPLVTKTPEARS